MEQVAESGAPAEEATTNHHTIAMRQREGKEGGGKGNLLSDELSLSLVGSSDQLLFVDASLDDDDSLVDVSNTESDSTRTTSNVVGSLAARDYKGECNQWLHEHKFIIEPDESSGDSQ